MKGRGLFGLLSLPFTGTTAATLDTSRAARPATTASDRTRVLDYIQQAGDRGATDDEIQAGLDMPGDTERPRRIELARAGCIEGREATTRTTRAGRAAVVWYFRKELAP